MKTLFRSPAIIASAVALASLFIVSNFSFAQQASPQAPSTSLDARMEQLINSQNRLASAMEKAFVEEEEAPETMSLTTLWPHPVCTAEKGNLPSSTTYKDSDWFSGFVEHGDNNRISSFVDLNGDGLSDYIFSLTSITKIENCVFLNNGSGWDRAHVCYAVKDTSGWTYYGDCADTSS